ncbi:low-density lipoprotein receptor-related protein 1-like [Haliotis cracherodii]|uniref:low-density lipoprotein receptor-related protein 1-like n=1 Tax=Haliotis cracherodii TaxID=6455 RepID=UPI0039EBA46D
MASFFAVSAIYFGGLIYTTSGQGTPELVVLLADSGLPGQQGTLFELDIHHMNSTQRTGKPISSPVAIDFDMETRDIYWTDIGTQTLRKVKIDGTESKVVAALTSRHEGLTLDSTTRQVFITDDGDNRIVRIEMDSLQPTVIVNTDLDKPRGIVVDTKNRKLYWVDWGSTPKIETCDYTGAQRKTLISGLQAPNDITIDEHDGRLFWTEGTGSIESVRVDGSDRKTIYIQPGQRFFSISHFNGIIFFTALQAPNSFYVSTDTGSYSWTLNVPNLQASTGIHVFSPNFNASVPCPDGKYGINCDPCGKCKTICEKTTGVCLEGCETGYTKNTCTQVCDSGTYGDDCGSACPNCKTGSSCNHLTGRCPDGCQPGWMGDYCDTSCPPKTYGASCASCGYCAGDASCDKVSGVCPIGCQAGWTGDKCDSACPPKTYGASCVSCGYCAGGTSCDRNSGLCPSGCLKGWSGLTCNTNGTTGTEKSTQGNDDVMSSPGVLVGITAAGLVVIAIIVAVVVVVVIKKQKRPKDKTYADTELTDKGEDPYETLGDGYIDCVSSEATYQQQRAESDYAICVSDGEQYPKQGVDVVYFTCLSDGEQYPQQTSVGDYATCLSD